MSKFLQTDKNKDTDTSKFPKKIKTDTSKWEEVTAYIIKSYKLRDTRKLDTKSFERMESAWLPLRGWRNF